MKKIDLQIQLKLENLDQIEDAVKKITKALEKECNCTCTLNVTIS
jgi:translation initiation factor 1 (eIF-1/SUI1)